MAITLVDAIMAVLPTDGVIDTHVSRAWVREAIRQVVGDMAVKDIINKPESEPVIGLSL